MNARFSTLILREWMQHKRGWLITMLLPPILFLLVLPFGQVQGLPVDHNGLPIAFIIAMMASTGVVFAIAFTGAMFQLPGLARRDRQDRSIEFWLSLPASHSESIGATLLTHALLVPLAAVLVGFAFGLVIAPGVVFKAGGLAGLAGVPWISVLALGLPILLRVLFGVLLMCLWLAPLMLITMAASAWLKRWGVPAVAIAYGAGGLLLDKLYGNRMVWELMRAQLDGAASAVLARPDVLRDQFRILDTTGAPLQAGSLMLHDALAAVAALASAPFIGGLIVAAGCFALLVLKRSRMA